jgi:hypothetical protein
MQQLDLIQEHANEFKDKKQNEEVWKFINMQLCFLQIVQVSKTNFKNSFNLIYSLLYVCLEIISLPELLDFE